MNSREVPSEYQEHITLVNYLKLCGYFYWHTPNETYTKSWNQKRKNTAMGVQSGIPDLFIIIDGKLYAIELKRSKGGVVSAAQKLWIERLNNAGIKAVVCKGSSEAIDFITGVAGTKLKKTMAF